MIKEVIAITALAGSAYAGLPAAYEYNPATHSGKYTATVTSGNVSKHVEVHVFGQEDIAAATIAGRMLTLGYPSHASPSEMEEDVAVKARQRYGNNPEMVKMFVNEARVAYIRRMRELNARNGLSIR